MQKWLLLGLGQGKHKMNLEHIGVSVTKGLLKKGGACHRDTGVNLQALRDKSFNNLRKKINNVLLGNYSTEQIN